MSGESGPWAVGNGQRTHGGPYHLARKLLEKGLSESSGRRVRVTALEGEPLGARSTYPIDRLRVTLDSGETIPMIFKRLDDSLTGTATKGGLREILIYCRLLPNRRFGAPLVYASDYDEEAGKGWLFLEDVGDWTLGHGDTDDWLAAARRLGEMHGTYLGRADELRALGCLAEHGPEYYRHLAADARRNLDRAGDRRVLARFDDVMGRYDALVAAFVRRPRTLVHGDIFPDNLILQDGHVVRPLDWEGAAIGLAAGDLARLLDGWGADKPMFVAAYLEEVERHARVRVDRRDFRLALTQYEVVNILWHLGWEEDACRDAGFVSHALGRLRALWHRLDKRKVS